MKIVLFLLIGFAVGAAALYFLQMKDLDRLDELEVELKKARRALAEAEDDHEQRLKEAIATLQDDYRQKQDQRTLNLKAEYEAKIATLKAQFGVDTTNAPETPAAKSFDEITTQTTVLDIPPQIPVTFEPPILAAVIQSLRIRPQEVLPTPTGKQIDPPILAQG